MNREPIVEQAQPDDADAIAALLERNLDVETLLLQPVEQIRVHIEEFVLVRTRGAGAGGDLRGAAQGRRHRPDVVEIMSVVVDPDDHGDGVGSACVRACVERAVADDVALIWLATTSPGFFARLGFERVPMSTVPFGVLLGKLGALVRQPIRRWPAALLGGQTFMRRRRP